MDNQLILFFPSKPVPFIRTDFEKQRGPGATYHLFLSLQNQFRDISLLVVYYLTKLDDVI